MRVHIIKNDVVVNTIEINNLGTAMVLYPDNIVIEAESGGIGWVWNGVTLSPPLSQPIPVLTSITPLQARRALLAAGLLDDVETMIAQAPREARLAWEYAVEIYRNDPTLAMLATSLGLTSDQIDDLFRSAAEIV